MSWRGDLRARLIADAALATLCGPRIGWFDAARSWERAYPQVVLQEVSPGRDYTHDGPDGLDHPRVQFDLLAVSDADLLATEAALTAAMEAGGAQGSTRFHEGFLELRQSGDPVDLGDGTRVLRLIMDFTFHWETV